jgi:hypothetical protein
MRASQLIAAAEVVGNVNNCLQSPPATESQARPLSGLEPEQQRVAWQQAVDTAPDGKVTAAHVENVVQELAGNRLGVHFTSDSPEWYTPPEIIERTVKLFGKIDSTPAPTATRTRRSHRPSGSRKTRMVCQRSGRARST